MSHSSQPVFGAQRQHPECRRVGDHDEIAAALHFRHVEAAAGREYRTGGLVRGVLGQQRRRHGDAALHQRRRILGHHGLAAQHAVLIGEREAHQFELVLLDRLRDRLGGARLLVGPKTVPLDEAGGGAVAEASVWANGEWRMAVLAAILFAIRYSPFAAPVAQLLVCCRLGVGALPIALPVAGRADAVDAGRAGDSSAAAASSTIIGVRPCRIGRAPGATAGDRR